MPSEEDLVRAMAQAAAHAGALRDRGDLSEPELTVFLANVYACRSSEHIAEFAARLGAYPSTRIEPLDEVATRATLQRLDCYFEREYPWTYAGFRFADDGTLVEFGFVCDLRRHLAEIRQWVPFKTRVSGFSARFSLVELRYAYAMYIRATDELRQQGVPMRTWGISIERNAFIIGVKHDVDRYQQLLQARFGPTVTVEQSYGASPG